MPARKKGNIDFTLLITVFILLAIGITMVFSASAASSYLKHNDSYKYLKSQGLYAIISIIAMLIMSRVNYRILGRYALFFVIVSFILLIAIFIPGLGYGAKGAMRWIRVGPLTMQPSEFAKTALIIFMARSLANKKDKVRQFVQGVVPYIILMAIYFLLIILQPNLSMAGSILIITFAMLFAAGARVWHLLVWGIPVIPALIYLVTKESYRLNRWLSFRDPWADPLNTGYQAIQSLLALGSGGLFGLGLGNSRQKFFYIPEAQNDFIFSIIGEELGFIGASTVLFLFLFLIWRGIRIALHAPDMFGCLLATGITCMIGIQVVINIAVVTVSMPTTGVTLPLISSGGTSLLFVMSNIGILLNISRNIKTEGS
ncbi:stage V sporulation protein E [Lutispora thermophila]|uniref:Probable peptidoglycan glycosyltransferase FtsW n=1 Tax=Lutispora thermophila DSM 19022 TaxID=1122184 RepID=A0A1M6CN20_9FIRM|nr:stage V sporulation protein E [Lutispora thermophila]SHI62349.1 cell division protein FtsW [Lutispora thermophila DSM 19022]